MDQPWIVADFEDAASLAGLCAWVAARDPTVSVVRPPREALLYEPDATLYGLALGGPMTVCLSHRTRLVRPGDVIVVPPGLALEFEPSVDLLAVACAGPVPDHFRERFIQVWGYDHFPAPGVDEAGGSAPDVEVLPGDDLRYRANVTMLHPGRQQHPLRIAPTELDLGLVVPIEGRIRVSTLAGHPWIEIEPGQVLAIAEEAGLESTCRGRAGLLRVISEPAFHARRVLHAARGGSISPEAAPRRQNPKDPEARQGNSA